jgi:hypothetical protein
MLAAMTLLACSLAAGDPPTNSPGTPAARAGVEVAHGVRISVPALGPARPADNAEDHLRQVFAFWVGLFGH